MGLVSHGHNFLVSFLLAWSQKCVFAFRPLLCHWILDDMPKLQQLAVVAKSSGLSSRVELSNFNPVGTADGHG